MGKSSLVIRLIDVVFILLFGFIAVSQIDTTVAIEPPTSAEADAGVPEGTHIIIIGVTKEGTYPIEGGDTVLKSRAELYKFLASSARQAENEGKKLGIRIRAYWDSPVEYGLEIANICRTIGIPKGLDVVKF